MQISSKVSSAVAVNLSVIPPNKKIAEAIMAGIPLRDFSKHKICSLRHLYNHAIPNIRSVFKTHFF
jgi:hypothetical protein